MHDTSHPCAQSGSLQTHPPFVDTPGVQMRLSQFAIGAALITLAATCGSGGGSIGAARPTVGGCAVLPSDNPWNTDISKFPVASNSAAYISEIDNSGATKLHPDFG